MRKVIICAICAFLVADGLMEKPSNDHEIIRPEYSISVDDNPNARLDFEFRQLVDPKSGHISKDIRQKELRFSQRHISRTQFSSLRGDNALEEDWVSTGPFNIGGRTRAVAIDISDPTENTIIAGGVSGGIWKTTDGGQTWRRTSDPELRNSVTAIVQDTRAGKENTWYYGTGELLGNSARGGGAPYRGDGIFKSIDNGESWLQIESTKDSDPTEFGSQFQYVWRLVLDHTDLTNDVIIAATYGGILRSEDAGSNWSLVLGVPLINLPDGTNLNESLAPFFTDIVKTEEGYFYAFLSDRSSVADSYEDGGVFFSDQGETWVDISGPTKGLLIERAVMDALDNTLHLFLKEVNTPRLFRYDLSSVDVSGVPNGNWVDLTNSLPEFIGLGNLDVQNGYNMMIKVMPSNPNVVVLGATNLYRSTDGFTTGDNVDWIGGYNPYEEGGSIYPNHHPDQHELLFFEGNSNKILSANDGGLHISNNVLANDVQWISLNQGYITSQFYTIDIPKSSNTTIITGGLQDNGSRLTHDEGATASWSNVLGGDGGFSASVPFNLHWFFSFQNGQIYRITFVEESSNFARVDPVGGADGSTYLFINPYVLDPINANIMYLAGGNAIWKNKNLSQIIDGSQEKTSVNWSKLESTITTSGLISALEATANAAYLYYGTTEGVAYRLETPGTSNVGVVSQLNLNTLGAYVSCISSNPEDDDELIVVYSNYGIPSLFHSSDAGSSFENIGGNLEEFEDGSGDGPSIRWVEIVPMTNGTKYFVGTSVGLYSTDLLDSINTEWVKESPQTIGKSVIRMMDYRPLDGKLVVATHGNGVFVTNVQGFKELPPFSPLAPKKFKISNAYPNPFTDVIEIEFEVPETSFIRIDIYDISGQYVKNVFYNPQFAGSNVASWDGKNQYGIQVKRGLYFYRIYYDNEVKSGRVFYNP